jgi:hypothetical protein
MLVQSQTAHVAEVSSECCSYQKQHPPHIAAEPSIIQLTESGCDQRCVVLGRLIFVFPGIVSFQDIEFGRCGFPFVVRFGL